MVRKAKNAVRCVLTRPVVAEVRRVVSLRLMVVMFIGIEASYQMRSFSCSAVVWAIFILLFGVDRCTSALKNPSCVRVVWGSEGLCVWKFVVWCDKSSATLRPSRVTSRAKSLIHVGIVMVCGVSGKVKVVINRPIKMLPVAR